MNLEKVPFYSQRILQLTENDDRRDVEFRLLIAGSQLRRISEYAFKVLDGAAQRATEEESASYGHAFVQMFLCTQLRGIDVFEAMKSAEQESHTNELQTILKLNSAFFEILAFTHHDKKLSPSVRPYKTPEQEKMTHGKFYRLLSNLCTLRGIDPNRCIETAIKSLEEGEWRRRMGSAKLEGITTYGQDFEGIAFVDPHLENINSMEGGILVTSHPNEDLTHHLDKIDGIVTDQGGLLCHAALIAREFNKPYLVGTGNATTKVQNGQRIRISVNNGKGTIQLL
jgi:phosphohistidine swiveling domain-containing protein